MAWEVGVGSGGSGNSNFPFRPGRGPSQPGPESTAEHVPPTRPATLSGVVLPEVWGILPPVAKPSCPGVDPLSPAPNAGTAPGPQTLAHLPLPPLPKNAVAGKEASGRLLRKTFPSRGGWRDSSAFRKTDRLNPCFPFADLGVFSGRSPPPPQRGGSGKAPPVGHQTGRLARRPLLAEGVGPVREGGGSLLIFGGGGPPFRHRREPDEGRGAMIPPRRLERRAGRRCARLPPSFLYCVPSRGARESPPSYRLPKVLGCDGPGSEPVLPMNRRCCFATFLGFCFPSGFPAGFRPPSPRGWCSFPAPESPGLFPPAPHPGPSGGAGSIEKPLARQFHAFQMGRVLML
ncbi:hypothetical protein AGDE_14026 [Angomonas deanei]|nr:hypothetical protein AGDE_14026 [Angomonas deanei]|eukprot:EPY21528.1 hypothetical protein AGDE_14026 [Angomonas deanei]